MPLPLTTTTSMKTTVAPPLLVASDDYHDHHDVPSGNQSTTSSERAWEEEYQQWKKAHRHPPQHPQQGRAQNNKGGGRRAPALSTTAPPPPPSPLAPPSPSPQAAVETRQRSRSASHQQLREKLSLAGSFSAEGAPSTGQRPLTQQQHRGGYHHGRAHQQHRRAVSPCIDSTLTSCGGRDEAFASLPSKNHQAPAPHEHECGNNPIEDQDDDDDERDDNRRRMRQRMEEEAGSASPIPEHFVKHIQAAFGKRQQPSYGGRPAVVVDLYRDVLQVDRRASDRDLRIAYFKRGRQVLSSSVDTIKYDRVAKEQFQAISMAYEILTTDELRSFYDAHGLVSSSSSSSAVSAPYPSPTKAQRPPSPTAAFEALKQQLRQPTNAPSLSSKTQSPQGRGVVTSASWSGSVSPPPTPPRSDSPALRGRIADPRAAAAPVDDLGAEEDGPAIRKKQSRSLSRSRSGEEQGSEDVVQQVTHDRRKSGKGRSRSASRSIRWNEHVEELVYERDPDELLAMRSRGKSQPPPPQQDALGSALSVMLGEPPLAASQRHQQKQYPKLRKVKRKVVLEAQQLAQELEALHDHKGNQERQNFVTYFLDDLEASLDGLEASVEDFWRFAIASTASSEESSNRARENKTAADLPGQDDTVESDPPTVGHNHEDEEECGEDHEEPARDHDTTSIGTEEFDPQPSRVRASPAPASADSPASAAATRPDLETTPSLDEEAEQELRSSKILEAFEMSDADSRSSSITSGRARAAEDPALNSDRPSVRERVAVLAAAAGQAAFHKKKPNVRLPQRKRHSLSSKSMSDDGDGADSLYHSLMKPHRRSSSTDEALASKDATSALDDVAKELFQDLTKPPPSGYEANRERGRHSSSNKKSAGKSRSRSCGPSSPKNRWNQGRSESALEPFDPFRLDDAGARPPKRIYDKGPQFRSPDANEDGATDVTVSTMSASEAPSNLRDRILAKHRAAAVAGRHRLPDPAGAHEVKSKPGASPIAVQAFDDDTFDVLSGFESQDPNIVKLDRTKGSGLSSLTGHGSHFTAQQEHAWRHLCATSKAPSGATTSPLASGVDRSEPPLGSACNSPSTGNDQDLVSQIMVYMQAFTEEVDRVGLSITNMMTAAVAVPEDNVQGVLNVLSKEMDSTK